MQRDPRAFLWDVREAALAIHGFITGMDVDGYTASERGARLIARAAGLCKRPFKRVGRRLAVAGVVYRGQVLQFNKALQMQRATCMNLTGRPVPSEKA